MFTLLLSIPKSSKHANPNEVNWESVHSHFSDLFSEDFICVVKPFNGDHTQAKVYFKKKVNFASHSDDFLINNSVHAKVIERKEEPSLPLSVSRTIRLPRPVSASQLVDISVDIEDQFRAKLCQGATQTEAQLEACHAEVLDYAEAALRKWADSIAPPAGAASVVPKPRSARRPLFPVALSSDTRASVAGSSAIRRAASAAAEAARELQRQLGPYDFQLQLSQEGQCSLRVLPHDITALQCDLMVVSTSCSLSLNYGLARVTAAMCGARELRQLCQQRIAQSGNLRFGETHLVRCPQHLQSADGADAQQQQVLPARHLLFVALPNDRRLRASLDPNQFQRVMLDSVAGLLDELGRLSVDPAVMARCVAMTPLGASLPYWSSGDSDVASEEFAKVLADAFWSFRTRTRDLRCINICDLQLERLAVLGRALESKFGSARIENLEDRRPSSAAEGREFDLQLADTGAIGDCQICCASSDRANPLVRFHCNRGSVCAECARRLLHPGAPGDGRCPLCLDRYRPAIGTQPMEGRMTVTTDAATRLPGHEAYAVQVVTYTFGPGIQSPDHPSPGRPYRGASRVTYFPDSPAGRDIVRRLRRAFDGRVVFTVGTSATTGMEDTVTWATVHHKTSHSGGPERHGYPDPTFLDRIGAELEALGY